MHTKLLLASVLLTASAFSPVLTSAQALPCDPTNNQGIQCPINPSDTIGPDYFVGLINTVANWLFTILLILAVVFIVMAAYKYLFSSGDGEAVEAAHKMLLYAAVAVAVALLSRGFVYVIRNVVQGSNVAQPGASQQGGGGQQGGAASGGTSDPTYSTISSFAEFGVRVQVCADGKIPGVIISDQDEPTGSRRWSNFTDGSGNVDLGGNPQIDPSQTGAAANAGEFSGIGQINTAILGLGIIGLGTDYNFAAETCNNGVIPAVIYNRGSGSTSWQQL